MITKSKVLCIYHANCADGLGAAWATHKLLGNDVEFVSAKYGEQVSNATGWLNGRDILIVDFSFSLPVLRAMADEARSVLVLDHHKTAQEDLMSLPPAPKQYINWRLAGGKADAYGVDNLATIFDLARSGAGLTWDYLSGGQPRPRIIDLVEDRDLWKFKYGDETRAFHAVLTSYDITNLPAMFERLRVWDRLSQGTTNRDRGEWTELLSQGYAILRAQRQAVAAAVAASRRTIKIAGRIVPCANVPSSMASDAGALLCDAIEHDAAGWEAGSDLPYKGPTFSATYYDGADEKRHFSLRSSQGGADVGEIAKQMAYYFNAVRRGAGYDNSNSWTGGGHEHAAGFDAPVGWDGE